MSASLIALPLFVASAPLPPAAPPYVPAVVAMAPAEAGAAADGTTPAQAPAAPDDRQAAADAQAQAPAAASDDAAAPPPQPAPAPAEKGAIVVTGRASSPADPVEAFNTKSYEVVQAVDEAVIAPVTRTYMKVVPRPVQDGLHNVLNNLDEPIVFINFLLQLKPGKALETLGRFVINSTIGVGGLIDVAKREPFNLPRRSNGLADTLGYYGVGPGPYLFLPIIGSTTVRDLIARPFDLAVLPGIVGKPFTQPEVALAKGTLSALDERANFDETLEALRNESADPYVAVREYYLARRRAEIDVLKGKRKSVDDPPFYQIEPKPVYGEPGPAPDTVDKGAPAAPAAEPATAEPPLAEPPPAEPPPAEPPPAEPAPLEPAGAP